MTTATLTTAATRRERWAWYFYDFGNSAYAAVVLLSVYSAYFQGTVVGGTKGSSRWGMAVGIAMLFVAITAPFLGTIADFAGSKKRFLLVFTAICCTFTSLLFFIQKGDIVLGMLFFILAEIGYRSAQVFYNSLLPEIAGPEDLGRVSGNGWAIGSVGGIVCLMLVLVPITLSHSNPIVVRLSLVFTAFFFVVSALPLFLWLRERAQPQQLPPQESHFSLAVKRLKATIAAVRTYKEFAKFIVAFLVFNDGILMIMNFGAILGAVLYGMEQQELIIFMIIVQIASVAGAYVFGRVASRFSAKGSLVVSLLLTMLTVILLYFSSSITVFYFLGAMAGFGLTGVQSVSRTMVGLFGPHGKSAEFYGFFALTGRTSSFIGPTVFGLMATSVTEWYLENRQITEQAAQQLGHRMALFSIVAFLAVGLIMLLLVNEHRGIQAARSSLPTDQA